MLLKAQHRDRGDRAEHLGSLDGSHVCMSVIPPTGLYCCLMLLFLLFWRWGQNLHLILGKHYSAELQPFLVYNLSLQITYLTRCFETLFKTLVFMLYVCECLHICAHVSDGYRGQKSVRSLELPLETVVSHHVGAGIQNWVLSKSSQGCSEIPPQVLFLRRFQSRA